MDKICTDVKQSRRLIELGIDINTADMHYMYRHWEIDENTVGAQSDASIGFSSSFYHGADNGKTYHYIPAWSLSALMKMFDDEAGLARDYGLWYCYDNSKSHCTKHYDNPIDAAVEMICWLLENK